MMNMKDVRNGQERDIVGLAILDVPGGNGMMMFLIVMFLMLVSTSWPTHAGKVVVFVDFCQ